MVAVAANAAWPPTEDRYLNDAELEVLYEDAGKRSPVAGGGADRLR